MQEDAQGQSPLHAASETLNLKWIGRLASAPRDASSCSKTTLTLQQAATDGQSIVPSATEHGCTDGGAQFRCSTPKRAEHALSWHLARPTDAENGSSTRSSASTGAE